MIVGIESLGVKIIDDSIQIKLLQDVLTMKQEGDDQPFYSGRDRNQQKSTKIKGPLCFKYKRYGHKANACTEKKQNASTANSSDAKPKTAIYARWLLCRHRDEWVY